MTIWATRNKPNTSWALRTEVETSWAGRLRPILYKAPLQDAYRIVHDQDDRIVYILTNSGTEIPGTFRKTRPVEIAPLIS